MRHNHSAVVSVSGKLKQDTPAQSQTQPPAHLLDCNRSGIGIAPTMRLSKSQ